MRACTIIARNYLAHARVLAESFLRHNPDSSFSVLVIDGAPSDDVEREPFETVLPAQILDEEEFQRMATIYDVLELATAVKPWLLRHLLADGGVVAYFDPDIEVFTPLDEIAARAGEHGIVLTPHLTDSAPRESNEFSEDAVLNAGVYNLGFIGVGEGDDTQRFLDWWMERVARECVVDPARGRFVDQRWVDFVPSLFDAHILRDPEYNVAWWNLANRELAWTGERYEVNGKPLRFFHFSGYSPDDPQVLSKHAGPAPPVLLSERPALTRICGEYAEHLLAAGYREATAEPYGFASLPGGLPLDRRMRRLYRAELTAAERGEAPEPPAPFDTRRPERFIEWLQEPADPMGLSGKVSRYLSAVYEDRPDLHVAFPNLRWLHADEYLEWVRTTGRYEEAIPEEFVPGPTRTPGRTAASKLGRLADRVAPNLTRKVTRRVVPPLSRQLARRRSRKAVSSTPTDAAPDLLPGVNVAGYFRAELGVGEAARHLIAGINEAQIPYSTLTYGATTSRQEHRFEAERAGDPVYDTNIICVNADQILAFVRDVGPELLADRYTIGLWWWEIGHFPEFLHDSFQVVDEVWVGSDFVAEAVGAVTSKPVVTLPLGIQEPKVKPMTRAQLGLPEGFVFLFSFDFLSVFERKNPLGLIEAFERAFAPGEGATLVLKSINGDQTPAAAEKLRQAAGREDVLVIDEYLSSEEKNALMATCDAYVSLHRSEGFGLTMAEAMALGKPVIATGYAGNMMFMDEENSYLVPYSLVPIPSGCEPYPAGVEWADPDIGAAAKLMRHVYQHQDEARAKGAQAREDMHDKHGPRQTAEFLIRRLEEIRKLPVAPKDAPPPREAPPAERPLDRAGEYLVAGPRNPVAAPGRMPFGRFARRVLFRVLRPYIARHQEFDESVVGSLREIDARLRDLHAGLEQARGHFHDEHEQLSGQVTAGIEELVSRVETFESAVAKHLGSIDTNLSRVDTNLSRVDTNLSRVDTNLSRVQSELYAEPYMSDPSRLRTKDARGREAIGFAANDLPVSAESGYRGFEDIFRGSEEFIRRRQRVYLELIGGRQPVLDVGCGRGEFLDLLNEADIEAKGIDIDQGMVTHSREKGHDVELADANAFLESQPDESYGTIFAAQVIEHMPYDELMRFFGLAERKLAPGGVFVAETVNPHSIAALKAFWVDPTHRNPIFPEVAAALAALHGFEAALIVFPGGEGTLEEDRVTQGEYALVATKQQVAVSEPESPADAERIPAGEPLRRRAT